MGGGVKTKIKNEAGSKKEAGGDTEHVFIVIWPYKPRVQTQTGASPGIAGSACSIRPGHQGLPVPRHFRKESGSQKEIALPSFATPGLPTGPILRIWGSWETVQPTKLVMDLQFV